ncbi:MAG TPA: hypothetical protein PLV23_08410 [Sedimentibacter sp.]|nr:VWA domain-containing protein [Tissierellia bacterium]HOK49864.1 hypothetical protein [Sedimentibacter sp.]HOW23641.1 hypothetical protein [Sedimentibacter sp.]HRC80682.1 hypothetical protein [Sedimentibacter sp.]
MKSNLTELVFILDRSGSMAGLETDTIGGFNSVLDKQKKEEGDALVTTVLFDHDYELLHDRINIKNLEGISAKEYYVRGTTALLDAMGRTINYIGNAISDTAKEDRPDKVVFVIITDGMENSSQEFSKDKVKAMIEKQKKEYSWEFVFLGANMDAIKTAADFGIDEDRASNFCADSQGINLNYTAICNFVSEMRMGKKVGSGWKSEIEKDYGKRGKKHQK